MSCDLVLVRCKNAPSATADAGVVFPPFGILSIASYLRSRGFEIRILDRLDPALVKLSPDAIAERILAMDPMVVGMSAMTSQCGDAMALGDALMRRSDVRVVHGGTHFSSIPEDGLAHGHAVVCGEGEVVLAELLARGPSAVAGILQGRKLTEKEMNAIPFPTREDLQETAFNPARAPEYSIITARGCPFDCNFCKDGFRQHSSIRTVSVDNVVRYLSYAKETLGYERFFILDDIFTLSIPRLEEIDAALKAARLDVNFRCFLHANTVTERRLEIAKEMGIDRVSIGVESGNDEILKIVGKGTTTARQRKAIELCKAFGFEVTGLFMIGNTGETVSTVLDTIAFARSLPTDSDWFSFAVPFPGTPFFDLIERYGTIVEPDYSRWNNETLVYLPHGFTVREMHELMSLAKNLCKVARPHQQSPRHPARVAPPRIVWTSSEESHPAVAALRDLEVTVHTRESKDSAESEEEYLHIVHGAVTTFERDLEARGTIGWLTAGVELLAPEDVECCNAMDEIWISTESERRALLLNGVRVPVAVIPPGVDAARFHPMVAKHAMGDETVTTFLTHGAWADDLGWEHLLTAWAEAFGAADRVQLVLATNPGRSGFSCPSEILSDIAAIYRIGHDRSLENEVAPIHVVDRPSDGEMPALHAAAQATLLMPRDRDWLHRATEAMATGVPVILATADGMPGFLRDENAFLATSTDALSAMLQQAHREPDARTTRGRRARADMAGQWPWKGAAVRILDRVVTLHGDPERGRKAVVLPSPEARAPDRKPPTPAPTPR